MAATTLTDETISAAQGGNTDAMWEIVSAHESLFAGIVHQVAANGTREQREDLLQEGRATLVERVRSYDSSSSSAALQTYVYTYVRRAIAEAWARMTTGLTVEPSAVLRVRQALVEWEGNQEGAYLALHARHDMSREQFMAVMGALAATESWDEPVNRSHGDHADLTIADVIADPASDVTDPVERRELAEWLLHRIDSRQSYALRSFYGIGLERVDDTAVCMHLRVTPAVVRKLRSRGITAAQAVASRYSIAA